MFVQHALCSKFYLSTGKKKKKKEASLIWGLTGKTLLVDRLFGMHATLAVIPELHKAGCGLSAVVLGYIVSSRLTRATRDPVSELNT